VHGRMTAFILFVEDLGVAEEFYRDRLGLAPITRDVDSVRFETGGSDLTLHRRVESARPFRPEIVFEVADADEAAASLSARDVRVRGPLALADGRRAAFCADPDGNVIKLEGPAGLSSSTA